MKQPANEPYFPEVIRSIGLDIICSTESKVDPDTVPPPHTPVEKKQTLKVFMPADLASTTLSFLETDSRLNYCLTAPSKKEGYDSASISSFSKADGKKKSIAISYCEGKITASELGLLSLNGEERMTLLLGMDHGLLLVFHFSDVYNQSTLKLLEGSIDHIVVVDRCSLPWAQRSNLVLVAGSDHSIYIVNCQKRLIVCQFRETIFEHKKHIGLYSDSLFIVQGFSDGHINLWEAGTSVRKSIYQANTIAKYDQFKRNRMMVPKYSLQSAASAGLVAIAAFFNALMLLTKDNWLKAIQMDPSLPETYLTLFEVKLKFDRPASHLQLMLKYQYALVSCGSTIVQVCFDKRGVYSLVNFKIEGAGLSASPTISKFYVDDYQQKFTSGIIDGKFFISQHNSLRDNLKAN